MYALDYERNALGWEEGVFHKIFGGEVRHVEKKWIQSDLKFCKNEESIRSETNEKGVNWIEN